MKGNFDRALKEVLKDEGGYSNHPKDPGGATMKGVIQRVYDAYRERKGQSKRDVRKITNAELRDIYRNNYWNLIRGDDLPAGVDYCIFDAAVNSGPMQAAKWLQRAIGGVQVDGQVGSLTVERAVEAAPVIVINRICDNRMAFLRTLRHWPAFGTGWTKRVTHVRTVSLAMATNASVPRFASLQAEETAKAPASETKLTETPTIEEKTKEYSAGGIGGLLLTYAEKIGDWASTVTGLPPDIAKYAVIAIGGLSLVAFVGFLGYSIVNVIVRRRKGEAIEAY